MKLFSRRKTFAVAAAAPIAAGMSAANYGAGPAPPPPYAPSPGDVFAKGAAQTLTRIVTPPKWNDFCTARDEYNERRAQRHSYQHMSIHYSIQVLKSVAPQHKIHMQHKMNLEEQHERETFFESLARNLGVWEFWKGGNQLKRMYDEPQPTQGGRY